MLAILWATANIVLAILVIVGVVNGVVLAWSVLLAFAVFGIIALLD